MKRRDLFALPLIVIPVRVFAQAPNSHISTTDPLVFSFTKGRDVLPGKVKIELPALADNGHSVAMTVRVDSPMTEASHVRAVHMIAEKNPVRDMAAFYFGPKLPRAQVGTRIRLNGSQHILRVAELFVGTVLFESRLILVRGSGLTHSG